MATLPESIDIFTDGSTCGNGKQNATGGYGVYFVDGRFDDISEPFKIGKVTNQRAELYAIYMGIKTIVNSDHKINKINIYSDSKYSIQCLTTWIKTWKKNNWQTANKKTVKNQDIIKPIDKLITEFKGKIVFEHVKAHTGGEDYKSRGNEKADRLAVEGGAK